MPVHYTSRKQPDYLLSPSPIKQDLFAQLLGTELKHNCITFEDYEIIEENNDYDFEECSSEANEEEDEISVEEFESDEVNNWVDENGLRKRKRKSSSQIKLLRQ
jgi:hypothetical protein